MKVDGNTCLIFLDCLGLGFKEHFHNCIPFTIILPVQTD